MTGTNLQKKEYAGIDWFRLIAAFLVVANHTSPLADWSETADFVLTRILARVAVPFFFMASGFFLFLKEKDGRLPFAGPAAFLKKTALLYAVAILLYLPLNIYTGTVREWGYLPNLLKDIVFDGTFYHLWYLPASILGALMVWLLLKRGKTGQAVGFCLVLYGIGLFGDSYYGISEQIPFLKSLYSNLFRFSDYTRNGLFFAPIFFLVGALSARRAQREPGHGISQTEPGLKDPEEQAQKKPEQQIPRKSCLLGLAVSFSLMLAEGLLLHSLRFQRHDSMYLMLLPTVFFLFSFLLSLKGNDHKSLRSLSMFIYLIHPAVIVLVRGLAKAIGWETLLIENSMVHFLAVALGSLAAAAVLVRIGNGRHMRKEPRQPDPTEKKRGRAWAEIRLPNLRHNVKVLRDTLPAGCRIMAVVKANAYGHGADEVSAYLNRIGLDAFAVATVEEGIRLRRQGVCGEILILGYTPAERAPELFRYRLSQTVADAEHARELNRFGKTLSVHIKVDTGMSRLGEDYRHVSEIASVFACKNLVVAGIFTHLCVSDSGEEADIAFTQRQIRNFYELLDGLKARGIPIPKTHIQSSYGVLNIPSLSCDYARIGIALYGVLSSSDGRSKCSLDLQPVLALKSKVVLVRTVARGESVGYGREFVARREAKVAVVSIGYADGFPRSLSAGKGQVLIHGRRVPVIGRICMDQLTADVTGLADVKRGDVVTLIGRDGSEEITAEEAAGNAGTITNELLSRLGGRLERVFSDSRDDRIPEKIRKSSGSECRFLL